MSRRSAITFGWNLGKHQLRTLHFAHLVLNVLHFVVLAELAHQLITLIVILDLQASRTI